MRSALAAARNLLKAWLLLVGVCGALGLIGWGLGGLRFASLFICFGLLVAAAVYWNLDRAALGMVGARELAAAEAPLLQSTVERLAARARVAKPRLYLFPDGHPRVASTGRGPRVSSLAVSAGFLSITSPAELEGVLAHELAHVRNRDVMTQTIAVVLAGALVESSRDRRLAPALAPLRSRARCGRVRPPAPVAEPRVRRRPGGRRDLRVAARARGRAPADGTGR